MKHKTIEVKVIDYLASVDEEISEFEICFADYQRFIDAGAYKPALKIHDAKFLHAIHLIMEFYDIIGYVPLARTDSNTEVTEFAAIMRRIKNHALIQVFMNFFKTHQNVVMDAEDGGSIWIAAFSAWHLKNRVKGRETILFSTICDIITEDFKSKGEVFIDANLHQLVKDSFNFCVVI